MFYTGVGSRQTPSNVLSDFRRLSKLLARQGWVLRSGGAPGADEAFERGHFSAGVNHWPQIFLPWSNFNGRREFLHYSRPSKKAYEIAAEFHPNWNALTAGGRALHARNVHQVLGPDLEHPNPSKFLICWTPNGRGGGGTGQAIRVAKAYDVPICDYGMGQPYSEILEFIDEVTK